MEESALTDVSSDQLLPGYLASYMWVNNSGPIAMHEFYKSNDFSCKSTFGVKKCGQVK